MTSRVLWIVVGVFSILAGVVALANPLAATLTAERIAGWAFLFVGIAQIFAAFRLDGWPGRVWIILGGVLFVFLGINLLANPLAGVLSLTLMVAILFLVAGIFRIVLSFSLRGTAAFWMLLFGGLISVMMAVLIFSNLAEAAAVLLGVLLAVELISNGVAMIALSATREATE